jgi:L,D-transpeptidase catalytic domain
VAAPACGLLGVAGANAAIGAPVQQGSSNAPASAPTPVPVPVPVPVSPVDVRLSNERAFTTWAHPALPEWIHSRPDSSSPRVVQVRMETEDGFHEVYLLLATHTGAQGRVWIKLRIPGRPNGRVGWVLRSALGTFQITHWSIVINLGERRLTAYENGHVRMMAPVGVGKPSTPTPPGHFWIRERFHLANRSNPYWPWALGTSDYSTLPNWEGGGVVGIHGPFGEPQQIPGDPSHGCLRMLEHDIAWLAPRVTLGTPVDIAQ